MFNAKSLRVEIQEEAGKLKPTSNFYVYKDVPIEVNVNRTEPSYSATIKIYGVSKEDMARMTLLKWTYDIAVQRAVRIYATFGNSDILIFSGNMVSGTPNYSAAPNIYIEIQAIAGIYYNFAVIPPTVYKGSIPAPNLIKNICDFLNISFYNFGVDKVAVNPYFESDGLRNRVTEISKAYDFNAIIRDERVEIYSKDLKEQQVTKWNVNTNNYVGYPSFTETGISLNFDEIFDIDVEHIMEIDGSEIKPANDKWQVRKVVYDLSTKINGKWTMRVEGIRYGRF